MASDRWRQVEEVFHAALARRGEDRRSFLAVACEGDVALLREVESLLAHESSAQGFMSVPAAALVEATVPGRTRVGARFGSYTLRALLGTGGMGEVYRAHDERLGREVAIKFVLPTFTADEERRTRFEREARMLATLNHPHIGAIYGVEEADGVRGLVLELVEGETLAERLASAARAPGARAPGLAESDALTIARQIAEALEAAHGKGIVHRDLKPANVKITPSGVVKVLDFGLATIAVGERPHLSQSPTMATGGTRDGAILGTVAYMSPEQARGKPLDRRTDIWSFGCVLYEMLTGRSPFGGETVSDTIVAILEREPDWHLLPETTRRDVRRLLRRCLEKDPTRRLHDVADVRIEIEDALVKPTSGDADSSAGLRIRSSPLSRPPLWRRLVVPTVAALAVGVAAGTAVWLAMRPGAPPVTRLEIAPTGAAALSLTNSGGDFAVTPDGSVIYRGTGTTGAQLFLRARGQLDPRPIPDLPEARDLFLSPDGQSIGFVTQRAPVMLSKAAISGGRAIPICPVGTQSRGATWGVDDIVFASTTPGTGLQRVSSGGGEPTILTTPNPQRGEGSHFWPQYLPGSQAVVFTIIFATGGLETAKVAVLDLRPGSPREPKVLVAGSQARYVPSGHLVYAASGALRAIRFDLKDLTVIGDPIPLPIEVAVQSTGTAEFDVGRDGTLAYVPARAVTAPARTLVWVDRLGHEEQINAEPRAYTYPRLSPDGTRVALDIRDRENDIWVWDFTSKNLTQVTRDPGFDRAPVWAGDRQVVYSSQERGWDGSLYRKVADGTGIAEPLTQAPTVQFPTSVPPGDRRVLFWDTTRGLFTVTLDKNHVEEPLLVLSPPPLQARNAEVSPDGQWLAYQSNESGPDQIAVRPTSDVNSWKKQVSTNGGTQPVWARSGRELFYLAPNGTLMGVTVPPGPTWAPGAPVKVFDGNGKYFAGPTTTPLRSYDVSLDGKRFLMIKQDTSAAPLGMVVVLNWVEELKRLLPRSSR